MRHSSELMRLGAALVILAGAGCTDSYLYNPIPHDVPVLDRSVLVNGSFCTDSANAVVRPVKIIVAMDTSGSMSISDPNGDRATAVVNLMNSLPQDDPEIFIGVLLFAGFTPVWLTNGGLSGFTQLTSLSATDRANLATQILSYGYLDVGGTDFVKPLDEVYTAISQDISQTAIAQASIDAGLFEPIRSVYSTIFLTDGTPSFPEDPDIDSRVEAIRSLQFNSDDCRLNTVHVFEPTVPPNLLTCPSNGDAGCPAQLIAQSDNLLQRMASEGGGQFRDFENHEQINFLNFAYGATKRRFVLGRMTLYNLNARPHSLITEVDSDGDGLTDAEELVLGTDPTKVDTIGDGFSDGVKVYMNSKKIPGTADPFTLLLLPDGGGNPGCPAALIGIDSDGDGILDCDETEIGTNSDKVDSDADGVSDQIEWLGGTHPDQADMEADYDTDGLLNDAELRMHMDPNEADVTQLGSQAYRYQISAQETDPGDGSTCYDFEIDNILLVPTLDIGGGLGLNNLVLSVSVVPEDEPNAQPITHIAHLSAVYPINGIKGPPDGILPVTQSDFARYLE